MVEKEVESEVLHPVISDKLTWEKINAFPIKSGNMSIEEMRQICVDFFRFTKTALWMPDEDLTFATNRSGGKDSLEKGKIYGGLPYVSLGSGNVYRLMDYYDEKTGVVDIDKACKNPTLFGNQCSISAYWAWGRVINSANYKWTAGMVEANYGLSDAYLKVLDSSGEMFFSCASREQEANQRYLNFSNAFSINNLSPFTSGDYTVEIVCQLSTGERLTLYSGKLVTE